MFAAMKEKALTIVFIALLVAAGFIAWNHMQDQKKVIASQATTLGEKETQIGRLEERLEKDKRFHEGQVTTESVLTETNKAAVKATTEAKTYVDKRLADIEKKYAALPETAQNKKARDMEVSLEQVRGLWAVYCIQALTDPVCK